MTYFVDAEIVSHEKVAKDTFLLGLKSEPITQNAQPGQFVNVRVTAGIDPLLRRPFSVFCCENDVFYILYRLRGKGTIAMSHLKPYEKISVIGPLGKEFKLIDDNYIFVAGGIGIAPLYFFLKKENKKNILLLYGEKSKDFLVEKILGTECKIKVATQDGSHGFSGTVIDLLESIEIDKHTKILACGPMGMLRELKNFAAKNDLEAYGSIEVIMGCGLGACLGCAIRTKNGIKYVCQDGPIFNLRDVEI